MTDLPQSFDDHAIRREVHNGIALYSLVNIVEQFSDTEDEARNYWKDTKKRLKRDGFELWENITQLKLLARDGKLRSTDVADAETCLRIIQSIPSPKAEPVRQWLAKVAMERIEEAADPELGIQRARARAIAAYERQGKEKEWIAGRLDSIDDRKLFTDALKAHVENIQGRHYGQATNGVYEGLWNRNAATLKKQMGLPDSANLRDFQGLLAVRYQQIVEAAVSDMLKRREIVTVTDAMQLIHDIAKVVGVQASELGTLMGMDLATDMPLLPRVQ